MSSTMNILPPVILSVVGLGNFIYAMDLTNQITNSCQIEGLSIATTAISALSFTMFIAGIIFAVCVKKNEKCAEVQGKNKYIAMIAFLLCGILLALAGAALAEIDKMPKECQLNRLSSFISLGGNFLAICAFGVMYRHFNV